MKGLDDIADLIQRFLNQDKYALARIITLVENDPEVAQSFLEKIHGISHGSYIIGITGSPGAGKSTLINSLAGFLAENGYTVGVISVDPSSPLSGGAFLGDRIRMRENILNPKVFIRSVASRGNAGGLANAVFDISLLYDAFGLDFTIIETVGAGQSEVDIFTLAYTIILVTDPTIGDSVQVQKAGILEIANIFVINKSDLGGDFLKVNLNMMLESAPPVNGWYPPIIKTIATENKGTAELFQAIQGHAKHLKESGALETKKRTNLKHRIQDILESALYQRVKDKFSIYKTLEQVLEDIISGNKDIYSAAAEILQPIFNKIEKIDDED